MRPDIGADEFGGCCSLATTEVPGSTITVTGAGQFEMRFNTAISGGIDLFFDLAEDPAKTIDLAGGTTAGTTLYGDGVQVGGFFYDVTQDNQSAKLDLLEATATRSRVRQEAFYKQEGGSLVLAGLKGFGDYSIYGAGRTAFRWTAARDERRGLHPPRYRTERAPAGRRDPSAAGFRTVRPAGSSPTPQPTTS